MINNKNSQFLFHEILNVISDHINNKLHEIQEIKTKKPLNKYEI
jgi:hypothetical protein